MFVCINNQYGMGTRIDQATANPNLHERAAAFGLAAQTVDGVDVEQVARVATELIDGARAGTPAFLAVDCYRFYGHARKDKSPYRDPAEEAEGRKKDPVLRAREKLLSSGLMTEAELDALDARVAAQMDGAIDFAVAGDQPTMASMFRDVYAPSAPEPEPVRTRLDRVLARE